MLELGLCELMSNLALNDTPFGAEAIQHTIRTNSHELKDKLHVVIQKQTIENIQSLNYN